MARRRIAIQVLLVGILCSGVFAQEPKTPPRLKDSVALKLHETRESYLTLQVQIMQMQQQETQLQNQYQAQLKTALMESGLDEAKYTLDPNTLNVTEKPSAKSDKK